MSVSENAMTVGRTENSNEDPPSVFKSNRPMSSSENTTTESENKLTDNSNSPFANDSNLSVNLSDAGNGRENSESPVLESTLDDPLNTLASVNKTCVPYSREDSDVDMADTTTKKLPDVGMESGKETREPKNDESLPTWLSQTIGYLRKVSAEQSWQDLVTEFVEFEKSGPPIGVITISDR